MKTILLLTAGLMLCSCGESDSQRSRGGTADRFEQLPELAQKSAATKAAVVEIERRMQWMKPGGQLEIEATKLREAQTRHEEAEIAYRKKLEE